MLHSILYSAIPSAVAAGIQEDPAPPEVHMVGIFDIYQEGIGANGLLGGAWLLLFGLGTIAGIATIFCSRLSWPPKVLHFLIGAAVVGLAINTMLDGLPPVLDVDPPGTPNGMEPADYAWSIGHGV